MDALSLSHLTYCCATITVNFHRLDHPPFPCKSRLLQSYIADKCRRKHRLVHPAQDDWHHTAGCVTYRAERLTTS
jgi:hypothetical protein